MKKLDKSTPGIFNEVAKRIKLEQRVSKLKMLTGLEFEIVNNKLQIKAGELSMSELDRLVKFCNHSGLEYNLESNLIFTITPK